MRDLFYMIIEWITRQITGLDNHCMSLWDLPVWLKVEHDVTIWCIIVCMLVAPGAGLLLRGAFSKEKKHGLHCLSLRYGGKRKACDAIFSARF